MSKRELGETQRRGDYTKKDSSDKLRITIARVGMRKTSFSLSSFTRPSSTDDIPRRMGRDSRLTGWLGSGVGSVVVHVGVICFVVFMLRGDVGRYGSAVRQTDEVGVVFSESLHSNLDSSEPSLRKEEVASNSSDVASLRESEETLINATERFLPLNEVGLSGGNSVRASLTAADASGDSGAGQTVGFGGVRGSGKKFVYVLDRSDSMSWQGAVPMKRAVAAAIASIRSLDPGDGATKFQVVAFNHDLAIFQNVSGLLNVTTANKAKCVQFLKSLVPSGGTDPEKALATALTMRPDVIFFLTDADEELSEQTLSRIQSLRRQCKVRQICVVEFRKSTDHPKSTYKRLAAENGGTYVFQNTDFF